MLAVFLFGASYFLYSYFAPPFSWVPNFSSYLLGSYCAPLFGGFLFCAYFFLGSLLSSYVLGSYSTPPPVVRSFAPPISRVPISVPIFWVAISR